MTESTKMQLNLGNKSYKLTEIGKIETKNVIDNRWLLIAVKDGVRVQIGDFGEYVQAEIVTEAMRALNKFDSLELIHY